MAEVELVKRWLGKAIEDFDYAALSLKEEFTYFPQICWHFQQSAEKHLKAYILAYDLEFKKIHDLSALLIICQQKEPLFKQLSDDCKYLQKYYIETRYPVAWETKYSRSDALKAEQAAKKVIDFVNKYLPA